MNLLLLILICVAVPAWIYFCTRLAYGEYKWHSDDKDWLFGGWSSYHPGHLRPIHFVKMVIWHIVFLSGAALFFYLATLAYSVTV